MDDDACCSFRVRPLPHVSGVVRRWFNDVAVTTGFFVVDKALGEPLPLN